MAVKTLDDLLAEGVSGRGVLVRSDLNVPLDDNRNITDPGRIIASVPTLKALSDAGAKVVVTAHLGRPKDGPSPEFSLAPVAKALGEQLDRHVQLAGDVVGTDALARAEGLTDGDILLLENIRFDPRETSKDDGERLALAKQLVELVGDRTALSCPTASESCTANRRPSTTSPPCYRTTRARWWLPRSRCSSS